MLFIYDRFGAAEYQRMWLTLHLRVYAISVRLLLGDHLSEINDSFWLQLTENRLIKSFSFSI